MQLCKNPGSDRIPYLRGVSCKQHFLHGWSARVSLDCRYLFTRMILGDCGYKSSSLWNFLLPFVMTRELLQPKDLDIVH
jgi:hypothetical protein